MKKLPSECDEWCPYRDCFHLGEDKGTYNPGRGYIYNKNPIPCCMTRLRWGCPNGPVNEQHEVQRPLPNFLRLVKQTREWLEKARMSKKVREELERTLRALEQAQRYLDIYRDQGENPK